jgi:5-methylcytosine-specific restriction enzyme subunit McrC
MQLRLAEYDLAPAVELSSTQRDALRRVAPSVTVAPSIGRDDAYDLTPGSHVGVVHLPGDLEVVIRPKLPMDRVLFLISFAIGQGRWADAPASLARADSLLEAIIPAFAYRLAKAVKRGVLQGYRSEDDALLTVRGRWRVGDQIRTRYGAVPPIEVSFDDYTEDIELNRLLRAALRRLLRVPVRHDRSRWPLRALDARLTGVRLVDYDPRRVPDVSFDRRTEHYRAAIGLARLILSGMSFDLEAGGVAASAFLIDMNKVFEDFVVEALRDTLGASPRIVVQGAAGKRLFLDVAQRISLKPDVSIWAGDRCRFVGDVKYKRIRADEFPNADLYQLTAYAIATGLPGGMLIYAAGPEEGAVHEVVHLGKRLELVPLDLRADPQTILAQVSALGSRIARVAA